MSIKSIKNTFFEELLTLSVDPQTLKVTNRESEHREFKLSFDSNHLSRYAKTMAAFANRDGGVIFFGVRDRPKLLVGVTENSIPDDTVFSNFLREYFEPEINFIAKTINVNDKFVHVVQVKPALKKPIICRKEKRLKTASGKADETLLREGAIYYRYSSSSVEIKYPELRSILDEQVQKVFTSLVEQVTLVQKVGYDRAAVVDASELSGSDKTASVYITNDTAKNMNWIDKGSFVEDPADGKNAFYVVRKVEIKQGIEVSKATDFSKSHPLTKSALIKEVKVNAMEITAILWKFGILDNPEFHVCSQHGKNKNHKFTQAAKDKIIQGIPLSTPAKERKIQIKKITDEYKKHQLKSKKSSSQ